MNILCGVTGSIAAILIRKMYAIYSDGGKNNVKFVLTESAHKILNGYDCEKDWFDGISNYSDKDEWREFSEKQTVLHIDLVKWADCFVIAPCTVNTLAKFAHGQSDNLLTCCFMAWDFSDIHKKCIIVPAANTYMYKNQLTSDNIERIGSLSHIGVVDVDGKESVNNTVSFVFPVVKELFCKDVGEGAMANIQDIKYEIDSFVQFNSIKY